MRVLIIEDDRRLARLVKEVLEEEKFLVDVAHDGDSGLDMALRNIHDVAVVDWMLPGRDAPSICRAIRAARLKLGLLILTARSQVEDRVTGLQSGADDYLAKPFAFDELVARIQALARRVNDPAGDISELRVGKIVMDLGSHSVRRAETSLELTKTEWNLLEYFMRHPNQVLPRENILDYVWSFERSVQESMVDVYVSYLRRKLDQPSMQNPIETVRGVGYRLIEEHA